MTSEFLPSKEWTVGGSLLVAWSGTVLQKGPMGKQIALTVHFRDTLPLFFPPSLASLPLKPPVWLSAGNIQTPVSWLNQTSFSSYSLVSLPPHTMFMCLWALHCCHSKLMLVYYDCRHTIRYLLSSLQGCFLCKWVSKWEWKFLELITDNML